MNQATLDLLDASISDANTTFLGYPDQVRFSIYQRGILVDPTNWQNYPPPDWGFTLNWNEFRYAEVADRAALDRLIPSDEPGVYIFYVRPERLVFRFPAFAFYIGIAGERGRNRPLRERLKDYLPNNLATHLKRKAVHRMLQLYFRDLWVAYAHVGTNAAILPQLETQLHGYLYPCFAQRDFPVEIKSQQRAFLRVS